MMIFYCIEDELSRAVAEKLISEFCPNITDMRELGQAHGGYGYIKKNLPKFVNLARSFPVLIVTDLDQAQCAPSLRTSWLQSANIQEPLPSNMLFCIAKTEIESWLLADTVGIAELLNISQAKIRANIENTVIDAKEYLVNLAKESRSKEIRNDLTPASKSNAPTGLNYNYRLSQFVNNRWNPSAAAQNSNTLSRAIQKLSSLRP